MAKRQPSGSFKAVFRGVNANLWTRTSLVVMLIMSIANLGASAGSKIYGMVADQSSYAEGYMMISLMIVVLIFILFFHRHQHDHNRKPGRKQAPNYTIGTGGLGAGVFFSGAIRCPKCRADMEQIEIQGTMIDRGTSGTRPAATATGHFLMPENSSIFRNSRSRISSSDWSRQNVDDDSFYATLNLSKKSIVQSLQIVGLSRFVSSSSNFLFSSILSPPPKVNNPDENPSPNEVATFKTWTTALAN